MKNVRFSAWTVPLALLVLCGLSYGLLAPWLGFYWDDWPTIWYLHLLGPAGFKDVFTIDRPLLGWLFMLTTTVLGESTLIWQVFGVLTHWLCCLALWWTIKTIWPKRSREAAWAALLFAVYPGFTQQYISVTYSHAWLILGAFFLSFGIMVKAVQSRRGFWPLLLVSWLLAAAVLFTEEYYFGLELLRPLILWWALAGATALAGTSTLAGQREMNAQAQLEEQQTSVLRLRRHRPSSSVKNWSRLKLTGLLWSPYLATVIIFLYWRFIVHVTPRGHVRVIGNLASNPAGTIIYLAQTILQDMVKTSLVAWAQVFNFSQLAANGRGPLLLSLAITAVSIPLVFFFLWKYQSHPQTASAQDFSWPRQAILLGVLALLVGGIPFWTTNLPIELRFPWDRFTLSMMFGASLLLAGLLALLPVRPLLKAALLAVLVGFAVGFHVQNANLYRREWNLQKTFFWQMVWRAPGIQPGTTILTAELPFTLFSDNSLTAPLNWTYAPQNSSRQMPYLVYSIESRINAGLPRLEKNIPISQPYRATSFNGSTSQAVAVYASPPGCLKVIDPQVDARLPQKPDFVAEVLPLSDPSRILPNPASPAQPPAEIFGPEPEHGWCYYFEKADLARQMGDWQQVVDLGKQAFKLNERLYEVNAPELVPYIEGYSHTGQWDKAVELTMESQKLTFRMQRMLCATWSRIQQSTVQSEAKQSALSTVQARLGCATP